MNKRSLLFWFAVFFCFSAFPQEQPVILDSGSVRPSERLRNVIVSLEELEQSETVSLQDLQNLKTDLAALDELLATSEATSTELQMQVDDALERCETLYKRYEKSQKQLKGWRAASIGTTGTTVLLVILLIALL